MPEGGVPADSNCPLMGKAPKQRTDLPAHLVEDGRSLLLLEDGRRVPWLTPHETKVSVCTDPIQTRTPSSTQMPRRSLRRLMVEPSQRRLILAAKVGIATMLTTLLTLLDGVYAFNELGAWATITVVITMQPTVGSPKPKPKPEPEPKPNSSPHPHSKPYSNPSQVGSTTNKGIQRCLGTVFAAAVAALVGVSARELLPWPEAGKCVVGLAVGSVRFAFTLTGRSGLAPLMLHSATLTLALTLALTRTLTRTLTC